MAQIIPELEIAILTVDLPEYGLCAGKRGVVVDVQGEGKAYILEFFTPEGDTIDVVYVHADQIRPQTVEEAAQMAAVATRRDLYPKCRITLGTRVELLVPQPEYGLRTGHIGEVLADFHGGYYYAVGFTTTGGVYIERPGIPYDQLRPITETEPEAKTQSEPVCASCGREVPARATK